LLLKTLLMIDGGQRMGSHDRRKLEKRRGCLR
jgi:hypothetical protein